MYKLADNCGQIRRLLGHTGLTDRAPLGYVIPGNGCRGLVAGRNEVGTKIWRFIAILTPDGQVGRVSSHFIN